MDLTHEWWQEDERDGILLDGQECCRGAAAAGWSNVDCGGWL
jgi:hypothetical protein